MTTPHPGKWEIVLNPSNCILDTGHTAVHTCVIYNPNTRKWKVLYFTGGQSRIWDPENPAQVSSPQVVPNWPPPPADPPNLFCSGHSYLLDGRLLVAGGHRDPVINDQFRGLPYTYIFNPITEQWNIPETLGVPHKMADGRWYPTMTTLGEDPGYGKILTMSGLRYDYDDEGKSVVNKDPQIYDPNPPSAGWNFIGNQPTPPPDATQPFDDLYTGAHVVPYGANAGKIFYSMPMQQAYIFNPFFSGPPNGGFWATIDRARSSHRYAGNSVLLPLLPPFTSAKVLIIGGGSPTGLNTVEIIDVASGSPAWTAVNPMLFGRRNANAVILPDDTILVVGGNHTLTATDPVLTAESYNPATGIWTLLPAMTIARMYHSTAILLPDARVWVSGTSAQDEDGPFIVNNNIEIYNPGYLFEGTPPNIIIWPDQITYGNPFFIDVSLPIAAIRLIRLGSVTHSTDMEQRSVGLTFSPGDPNGTNPYTVNAPANANIAPPGFYMLFVLRDKQFSLSGQTMIPSVAKIVKLSK